MQDDEGAAKGRDQVVDGAAHGLGLLGAGLVAHEEAVERIEHDHTRLQVLDPSRQLNNVVLVVKVKRLLAVGEVQAVEADPVGAAVLLQPAAVLVDVGLGADDEHVAVLVNRKLLKHVPVTGNSNGEVETQRGLVAGSQAVDQRAPSLRDELWDYPAVGVLFESSQLSGRVHAMPSSRHGLNDGTRAGQLRFWRRQHSDLRHVESLFLHTNLEGFRKGCQAGLRSARFCQGIRQACQNTPSPFAGCHGLSSATALILR